VAGYGVDYAVDWPNAVMLNARAGDRSVRAFVYRDEEAAATAHRVASAQQSRNADVRDSDDAGPQLLSSFGASAWRRNVAVVESSPELFSELMPSEIDCADPTQQLGPDLSRPAYQVDATSLRLMDALP
jgi:hypothetical protein